MTYKGDSVSQGKDLDQGNRICLEMIGSIPIGIWERLKNIDAKMSTIVVD